MFSKKSRDAVDMLNGSLWDKLILFAIPLALTGVLQQLLNAADVAVLGQFVGKNAVAAVGNNISLIGLLVNLFMGLSLGANVLIAQNIGAKKLDRAKQAVHTAFILAFLVGIFILVAGEILTDPILEFMEVPSGVRDMAEIYLRIYLLGMPVLGLYNFEAAIFRSRGDTSTPLFALFIASISNITLNLLFVLAFGWGVHGVAAATAIAGGIAAVILYRRLRRSEDIIAIDPEKFAIDRKCLREIIRIGLPAGIQGMMFSLSNLLIQSAINSLGPDAMAASAAAFTIEINIYCIVNGFSQAATTFTSQNYGAGNLSRCRRIFWVSSGLSTLFMSILAFFIVTFAEELLEFFSGDVRIIDLGKIRIYFVVLPQVINVFMDGMSGALRGYGISIPPALICLFGICALRIVWLYTVFPQFPTFSALMAVYPVSWIITTLGLFICYRHYTKKIRDRYQKA